MNKKKSPETTQVNFPEILSEIRNELEENYGGVTAFLKTKKGEEMGGMKIRPYLYEGGPKSYAVVSRLYKYLGLGVLSRKTVVSRTTFYYMTKSTPEQK